MKSKNLNRIGFISTNAIRQVLVSVFAMAIPFLVIYYSGKEIWGEFVSILLFNLIATQFINWGNKEYLLRTFSEIPSEIKNTFSSNLLTRFPLVILFSIIGFFYFKLDFGIYIFLWLFGRFLIHSFEVLVVYEKKFIYSTIIETVCFLIFLLIFYYFKLDLSLKILLILYSLYQLIKGFGYFYVFRNFILFSNITFNIDYYKISFWFFLLSIFGFLSSKIDVYIIEQFGNKIMTSDYQIINSLLVFIMSIAAFIYVPFTKNLYRTNDLVISKTKKSLFLLSLLIIPISLAFVFAIDYYFLHIKLHFSFYKIAFFYVFPSYIYGIEIVDLFKQHKEKKVVLILLIGTIINSLLSYMFLKSNFGIIENLLGSAIAQLVVLALFKFQKKVMKKLIYNPFILCLLIILALTSSCSKDDEVTNSTLHSIEISTGTIYPEFNPEIKDYYITSLNTLKNIQITLNDYDTSKKIYINGIRVQNKITSLKLDIGDDIVIQSGSNNETYSKYTIHYLPSDLPKTNVITKNNPSEGFTLINMFELTSNGTRDYCYISILNNDGFPIYYKKLPYQAVINFKYFLTPDNQKRFSYNINELGKTIIMNDNFEEINQLKILPYNGHESLPIDNHDFIYLNENHYIIPGILVRENIDMTAFGGSNSVDLIEIIFQEIQNNQVIFEWNSADHPELLSATDPIYYNQYATANKVDYFHFNSINIDPNDQNFIISARHTNQIYKINRTTGEIMWRFGGNNDDFNLTENQIISHPHHATILANGNLLLFDNGVTKTPKQSRIVEFDLDENNFSANLVNEYAETGRYFDIMGSVQKLQNGNYLIGWGGNITSQVNANKSDITEIDINGNIVLDLSFSNNPNSFTYSYRALKYNISF